MTLVTAHKLAQPPNIACSSRELSVTVTALCFYIKYVALPGAISGSLDCSFATCNLRAILQCLFSFFCLLQICLPTTIFLYKFVKYLGNVRFMTMVPNLNQE